MTAAAVVIGLLLAGLPVRPASGACPAPDAEPVLRMAADLPSAQLTLLRCTREELRRGDWASVDMRLAAARQAGPALSPADAESWRELVDRLTATRVVDAHAWRAAESLTAPIASSRQWLRNAVVALADARLAWRTQDRGTFARVLAEAHALRALGRSLHDIDISRAALLVQAAAAGGQYERDEMQMLLEAAHQHEMSMRNALGESYVPVVIAMELEADLWLQTDRYARAADVYRVVVTAHPGRPHGWIGLSKAYRRLGHDAEAVASDREARRLSPDFTFADDRP